MANLCYSWVEISGPVEDVKKFTELVGEEFDFEKVIPTETHKSEEARNKWGCSSIAFVTEFDDFDLEQGHAKWVFWTKWVPPVHIYKALVKKFPEVFISWRYEESGEGLYGFFQNEEVDDE